MSANQICIVLTATPFVLLIWDIFKSHHKRRKLRKQFYIVKKQTRKFKKSSTTNNNLYDTDIKNDYVQACWDELNKKK